MYVCPAVYVNSSWKWLWAKNGALLFGTVVLLLNIYRITHFFQVSHLKCKAFKKYVDFIVFHILDYLLIFTFKYIQIKHFFNIQKLLFSTCYLDMLFKLWQYIWKMLFGKFSLIKITHKLWWFLVMLNFHNNAHSRKTIKIWFNIIILILHT